MSIPGEMKLGAPIPGMLGTDSQEVARIWVTENGPCTALINPHILDAPEVFGMLLADTLRHAARAYSQAHGKLSEAEALDVIREAMVEELDTPTTELTTVGSPN